MGRIIAVVLTVATLAAASPGLAQDRDQEARDHFDQGVALYDEGRFAEAAEEFAAAHAISGADAILYNVYVARRDSGDVPATAAALRQYLASDAEIEDRAVLERRLAALEEATALQALQEATARQRGEADTDAAAATATASDTATATHPAAATATDTDSDTASPLPWILIGTGAASTVGALIFALLASGTHGQLEESCPGGACPPDRSDEIATLRAETLLADVFGLIGLGASATGIIWLAAGAEW